MSPLELWAGPECTVNRVEHQFNDQMRFSGFAHRLDDLDRLASLGITRLRFPLLWERTAPAKHGVYSWQWSDERIKHLHALQVSPIVGLLHHGSGPTYTNLLNPAFAQQLADYAQAVAERYPDISAYTPVNEPVTTARFSGLYGLWYPHLSDDRSFVRALLNQMRGTVLAMRAIRVVNPLAQLVQTDDLGFTSSVPRLQYQANFENLRRWLSFDLLCGRVYRQHPLWSYLRHHGATEAELQEFVDEPCPPDIVGLNCYLTSERFLDNRMSSYPSHLHGGNGRDDYADVETVRVQGPFMEVFETRLREACTRYNLPVVLSEVHLGCTREEQLRWLYQAWSMASSMRLEGLDIRAVTAWAAFGTYDWNSLVTRINGHYESGLWDVSSGLPRPTALATLAKQLAHGQLPTNPVLAGPGWWERDLRLIYPPFGESKSHPVSGQPLIIAGATGTLGRACARLCELRGLPHRLLGRHEMDIADLHSVEAVLKHIKPWAVINSAGFVRVDEAESEPRHWRENVAGPAVLAQVCARLGIRLLSFSSDLVFNGDKTVPYVETDTANPLNSYGCGKLEGERQMFACAPNTLVIRTAAFFSAWDQHNFVTQTLNSLRRHEVCKAANDQFISPTYVPDLVNASLDLLIDGEQGLWHLANRGTISWSGFAQMAAESARLDAGLVRGLPSAAMGQVARRPRFSALGSERGILMPTLEDGLKRYLIECEKNIISEKFQAHEKQKVQSR